MTSSSDLKLLFQSNEKVYKLNQNLFFNGLGRRTINRTIESINFRKKNINSLQARVDLVEFVDNTSNHNGELIVSEIENQQKLFENFAIQNPNIKNFTKTELNELLKTVFENYRESKSTLLLQNFKNKTVLKSNCLGSFNVAFNACDSNYNWTMVGIWVGVLLTAPETGGATLAVGLVGSIIAEAVFEGCINDAASNLTMCDD